jgi:hypothetical protein
MLDDAFLALMTLVFAVFLAVVLTFASLDCAKKCGAPLFSPVYKIGGGCNDPLGCYCNDQWRKP